MNVFFLLTFLCFGEVCMQMPTLGPGTQAQCQEALTALTQNTPLPPGYVVRGFCIEENEA